MISNLKIWQMKLNKLIKLKLNKIKLKLNKIKLKLNKRKFKKI